MLLKEYFKVILRDNYIRSKLEYIKNLVLLSVSTKKKSFNRDLITFNSSSHFKLIYIVMQKSEKVQIGLFIISIKKISF